MTDISRDEIERIYKVLDEGFRGIHARLDVLNGRTRASEQKVAVLEDRAGVGQAAAWGGGVAGIIYGVIEVVKWVTGR